MSWQGEEACETMFKFIGRKWAQQCQATMRKQKWTYGDFFPSDASTFTSTSVVGPLEPTCFLREDPPQKKGRKRKKKKVTIQVEEETPLPRERVIRRVDKLFLASSGWDNNYHHFLVDSMSR